MTRRLGLAAAIWGASILLTKVVAVLREAVIGRVLGGGADADLYFLAFTLPDFLNYLLAGGALSIVFIPIFSGYLARGDEAGAWRSLSRIGNVVLLTSSLLCLGIGLLMPALVPWIGPGLDAAARAELVSLTRIMLPAQVFHLLGGLLSAALQARDRHGLAALAPLVYTLGIILGGLLGGVELGAHGFAWGVLVGSVVGPFLLPLLGCLRDGMRWSPILEPRHPDLRDWVLRSLPIMVAFSIIMADDMILRRQASLLGEGAISTLEYAKKLMKVPMGVFGLAAGVATYPALSRLVSQGDRPEAYRLLVTAVKRMLVLAFGAQVVLTAAGAELSALIYGGRIDPAQHAQIGQALGIFCLALWAWSAQTLLSRGFYALGKTWLPSLLGTLAAVVFFPLYVLLGQRLGTAGLALASSLAISGYVLLLGRLLRREYAPTPDGFGSFAMRALPAVLVPGALGLLLGPLLGPLPALVRVAIEAGAALLAYIGLALLLRLPEAREVAGLLLRRLRRRAASPA